METEVKKIPYLNLKAINEPYEKEIKDAINKVVNSGWYLQGEAVKGLRNRMHSLSVQNTASAALMGRMRSN